jgi:hypothetical protein
MGMPLVVLGLVVAAIAFVWWARVRTDPGIRREASTDGGFSPALFDGGDAGSADCGDGAGADGGGCDGGGGDGGGGGGD